MNRDLDDLNPHDSPPIEPALCEPRDVPTTRNHSHRGMLALIGLGLLVVLLLCLAPSSGSIWLAGMVWGTLYGHFVAAGFVLATHDGRLTQRLTVTSVWLATLIVSFFLAATISSKRIEEATMVSIMTTIIGVGVSLSTALSLWSIRRVFGLRVVRASDEDIRDPGRHQFSIRQLLFITTIIAGLLGLGRALIQPLLNASFLRQEVTTILILSLIGLTAVLTQAPNWLALLSPSRWLFRLLVTLVFTAAIDVAEFQLLSMVNPRRMPDLSWIVTFINVVATSWSLAFAFASRRAGYRVMV